MSNELFDYKEHIPLMELVQKFHTTMLKHNLMLVYEGEINQMITTAFTSMAERNMDESTDEEYPIYKRLHHVMVECFQNVCRHAEDAKISLSKDIKKYGSGILMVSETDKKFTVLTGNIIHNEKVKGLELFLTELNEMNQEQVKSLYKEKIKESRLSDKGGAGLGFIDIVKKTGNKIRFKFEKIDENTSFFIQEIAIN